MRSGAGIAGTTFFVDPSEDLFGILMLGAFIPVQVMVYPLVKLLAALGLFALFTLLYLLQARTYLIDPSVHAWSAPAAVASEACCSTCSPSTSPANKWC